MAEKADRKRRTRKATGVYLSVSGNYEIAYRDSDGRQVFKTLAKGVKLEQAKAERADIIAKLGRGEPVRSTKQTFGPFAEEVITSMNRRPRTIDNYKLNLRVHLNPRFEKKRLADISTSEIARMVADLERKGYAGWTISGILSTLSLIMRKAKRRGLIPANPVLDLERDERPTIKTDEKRVLDQAEVQLILAKAGETFRAPIATMIFTGLRLGEVLGLTWADVDFDNGLVHVRYQLDRKRTRVPIKTEAGRRDVVLIPQLAQLLKTHKVRSGFKRNEHFVFASADGRGREHRTTSRGVKRAVERAELGDGLSSHNFRHTFASLLIVGLNLDPVRVSKQLGHTRPSFTQDCYTHLFEQARHANAMRDELEQGFGHLLRDVNAVSTSA